MEARFFATPAQLALRSLETPLGRNIISTNIWAVHQGLRGASAYELFDGYCQQLVIDGVPLWRAQAGMQTLHPQWAAYSYLWRATSTPSSRTNMRVVISTTRNGAAVRCMI
jgi:hypothetical protein